MSPRYPETCPSDLRLDLWRAGELGRSDAPATVDHIAGCVSCRRRVEQREVEHQGFLRDVDAGRHQMPPVAARRVRWRSAQVLAAAAALAVVVIVLFATPPEPAIRSKGDEPDLRYWVLRRGVAVSGDVAGVLSGGDVIRFGYSWNRAGWLALISVDGRGVVTVYSPDATTAWRAAAGRDVLLPDAIRLDDTPGLERVHALFCDRAIELAPVRAALATSREPPVEGCRHLVLTLPRAP